MHLSIILIDVGILAGSVKREVPRESIFAGMEMCGLCVELGPQATYSPAM